MPRRRGITDKAKVKAYVDASEGVFTISDVVEATEVKDVNVRNYLSEWTLAGALRQPVEDGKTVRGSYYRAGQNDGGHGDPPAPPAGIHGGQPATASGPLEARGFEGMEDPPSGEESTLQRASRERNIAPPSPLSPGAPTHRGTDDTAAPGEVPRTHDLHTGGDGADISPLILSRAVVIERVDDAIRPTGDGILSDARDTELIVGVPASQVRRYVIPTDAMQDVLPRGAEVAVTPVSSLGHSGIYVLALDGAPHVARVQRLPGGAVRLSYACEGYVPIVLLPDTSGGEGDYVEAESGLHAHIAFRARVQLSFRTH